MTKEKPTVVFQNSEYSTTRGKVLLPKENTTVSNKLETSQLNYASLDGLFAQGNLGNMGWDVVDSINTKSHNIKNKKEIVRLSRLASETPLGRHILSLRSEVVVNGINVAPAPNRRLLNQLGVSDAQIDDSVEQIKSYLPFLLENVGVNGESLESVIKNIFQTKDKDGSAIISRTLKGDNNSIFQSRYQVISGSVLSNPDYLPNGYSSKYKAYILDGIELDKQNFPKAYFLNVAIGKWIRIPVKSRLGFSNTALIKNGNDGVPVLFPVISLLDKVNQYRDAELAASMLSTLLLGENKTSFGEADPLELLQTVLGDDSDSLNPQMQSYLSKLVGSSPHIEMDGRTTVVNTTPFSTFKYYKPEHPHSNYPSYIESLYTDIGAGTNVPYEFLTLRFTSSYSASQTALSVMWQTTTMPERSRLFSQGCKMFYNNAILELNKLGLVDLPLFNSEKPDGHLARIAWLNSAWSGSPQPAIDTLKILKTAEMQMALGVASPTSVARDLTGRNWTDEILPEIKASEKLYLDASLAVIAEIEKLAESGKIKEDVRQKLIDTTLDSYLKELTRK